MPKTFKLEITFDPMTKDCKVTGPVNEPDLCYMGLELARRVIAQHKERAPLIISSQMPNQQAKVPLPSFLRPRG
jgi:hypothetical protein